jgi:hypothetical protein
MTPLFAFGASAVPGQRLVINNVGRQAPQTKFAPGQRSPGSRLNHPAELMEYCARKPGVCIDPEEFIKAVAALSPRQVRRGPLPWCYATIRRSTTVLGCVGIGLPAPTLSNLASSSLSKPARFPRTSATSFEPSWRRMIRSNPRAKSRRAWYGRAVPLELAGHPPHQQQCLPHLSKRSGDIAGLDHLPVLSLLGEHFVQERLRPGEQGIELVHQ